MDEYDPIRIVRASFRYDDPLASLFDGLCVVYRPYFPDECENIHRAWIYFLINRKQRLVDYVGKANNLRARLSGHHVFDRDVHDVVVTQISKEHVYQYEAFCIKTIRPPRNGGWIRLVDDDWIGHELD